MNLCVKPACRAFTLIEVVLVLAIIAILSLIGLPTWWDRDRAVLLRELEQMEVVITFLQQQAQATNTPQVLVLQPQTNSYTFLRHGKKVTYLLAPGLAFGVLPKVYGPPAHPTGLLVQAATFPAAGNGGYEVRFLPNCQITPGAMYIKASKTSIMGALTCSVSQVSYIRRYVYKAAADPQARGSWLPL